MTEIADADIAQMHRALRAPDGTGRLLRWLALRSGGPAGTAYLIGRDGILDRSAPADPLPAAAAAARRVLDGPARAASAAEPGWQACIARARDAAVMVTAPDAPGLARDTPAVTACAADLLGILRLAGRQSDFASGSARTILGLLLDGHDRAARRVAGLAGILLPERARITIVEGPARDRTAALAACEEQLAGTAVAAACPARRRHVILLAPAGAEAAAVLAPACPGAVIGTSGEIALRDTATGRDQALDALEDARDRPDRTARYTPPEDLATAIGTAGRPWADARLAPLSGRRELARTLESWLTVRAASDRQLGRHRNTRYNRLKAIAEALGITRETLDTVAEQAELHLALTLQHAPAPAPGTLAAPSLDTLLTGSRARSWARLTLAPLRAASARARRAAVTPLDAVSAWLDAGACMGCAASRLGVSRRTVQDKIHDAEQALDRDLRADPTGRYDLFLALRISRADPAAR